jgi:hypothetical protein
MCRRSRDNAPARNAFFQTKLAAQDATSNSAVWGQRARSVPSVPASAGPPGLASPGTFTSATVDSGCRCVSRCALHWSGEIPAGPEPGRCRHQRTAGCTMLLCRTIWFVVSAFADRRRYSARRNGAARREKQGRCSAGKFGGQAFGFRGARAAGRNRSSSGAGDARSEESKNLRACGRNRNRRSCGCCKRDRDASRAAIFLPHEAEVRSFAGRVPLNDKAAWSNVQGAEHERDSSACFYLSQRRARGCLRFASSFSHMAVCMAAGETFSGYPNYTSGHWSARSCASGVARSIRRDSSASGCSWHRLGCNFDRRCNNGRGFCTTRRAFLATEPERKRRSTRLAEGIGDKY